MGQRGSKAGYTDTGQQTTKIKQETVRQKINRANTLNKPETIILMLLLFLHKFAKQASCLFKAGILF